MRVALLSVAALAFCTSLVALPQASAEDAAAGRPLVELVPADAGICIDLTELYAHAQGLTTNPLLKRMQEFPPLAEWAQQNGLGLEQIIERLAQSLGVTPDEMGNKLFGRHAILAAWPPEDRASAEAAKAEAESPEGQKLSPAARAAAGWNEGQGLALIQATDAALLEKLINQLSGAEVARQRPDMAPRVVEYAGAKYLVRAVPRGEESLDVYFANLGTIGVLSNSERVMRSVLELHAGAQKAGLAQLETYQAAMERVPSDAAIRVFVNPRTWDDLMLSRLGEDLGDVELIQDGLTSLWQASKYWVASVELDRGLRVDAHMQFDESRTSPELAEVLSSLQGNTDALSHIRDDAVLALALRVDLGKLAGVLMKDTEEQLAEFDDMRDMARSMFMGMDIIEDILPQLGPDVRISLRETRDERNRPVPGWVIGVQTKPRAEGDDDPAVAEVLQSGVGTALQVAATFVNNRFGGQEAKTAVRVEEVNGVKVTSLDGMRFLPAGLVPTYAVYDEYFMFGSSRQAVVDTIGVTPETSLAKLTHLQELLGSRFATPGQLLYIDCPKLRKILKEQPQLIRFTLGAARGLSTRQVSTSLQRLDEVLALAETIVAAAKFEDHALAMTLVMSVDEPPKREVARVAPAAEPAVATP